MFGLNECNGQYFYDMSTNGLNRTVTQYGDKDRDHDFHEEHRVITLQEGKYCQFCYGTKSSGITDEAEARSFSKITSAVNMYKT